MTELAVTPPLDGPGTLAGRVVLVTGASQGLGAAVALAAAAAGAQLVLLGRRQAALEAIDDRCRAASPASLAATLVPMDLADGPALDRLGPSLGARYGRLDGLVAAAAVLGPLTPVGHLDPAAFAAVLAIDVLAQHRLFATAEPLLRAAPAGRAVVVTCAAARAGLPFWGAHAAAKAALEALTLAWAAELQNTTVRVNLADPGPMATKLRAQAFPGEPPTLQPSPAAAAERLLQLLLPTTVGCGQRLDLAAPPPGTPPGSSGS